MRFRAAWLAVLIAAVVCCGLVGSSPADEPKSGGDQHFVQTASASGLAEVSLGKLAAERATNPEVKKFAQRMVKDHTMANTELNRIADKASLPPARAMDAKHEALMQKLTQLSGAPLDREYMQHMVKDHQEAVSLFEREAKEGKDPALKAFAEKTLPTLREHLKMAQDVAGGRSGGNGTKSGSQER